MNERFIAVSTVAGSRICGCFSKRRSDFSVTKGGNRWSQLGTDRSQKVDRLFWRGFAVTSNLALCC